jgi:hypothetical protein
VGTLDNSGVMTGGTSNPATSIGSTGSNKPDVGGTGILSALAHTGLDLERDAEIGAALVAGGWAMQFWANREPGMEAHTGRTARTAGGAAESAPQ